MKGNRKSNKSKVLVLLIMSAILGIAIVYANTGAQNHQQVLNFINETGEVVQILEDNSNVSEQGIPYGDMLLELKILTGSFKGQIVETTHFFNQISATEIGVGDRLAIQISFAEDGVGQVRIQNPERSEILVGFFVIFLLILGLIGGKRGVMAILGLMFTMTSIIFLLIPLMLKGYPVIGTTLAILLLVTVVTLVLLGGITPKTISAILGCMIGVLTAVFLSYFSGNLVYISGLNMEEAGLLLARTNLSDLQVRELFISGVLIASLGAVMDTAVSVASAMEEIKIANPKISPGKLFKSGMNVGKDTMGTMSNTLILAFAGSSLNMVILIYSQGTPFNQIINDDFIVLELIRGLSGSLGIIFTVPAVAFFSAMLMGEVKEKN